MVCGLITPFYSKMTNFPTMNLKNVITKTETYYNFKSVKRKLTKVI